MNFADRLQSSIERSKSFLVAGLDPAPEQIPEFALAAAGSAGSDEEFIRMALERLASTFLDGVYDNVCALKPNSAFFEQFGIGGVRALVAITRMAKERGLPVIWDAKRGDIGNTALAYARAAVSKVTVTGRSFGFIEADAVTVNPFLGLDTVEPYLSLYAGEGKGVFVLVRTSNPGAHLLQSFTDGKGVDLSERLAQWVAAQAEQFRGNCGYSGFGAVVGATDRAEALHLRGAMPTSFFLVPGMGTQGGTADDAAQSFARPPGVTGKFLNPGGAIINVSRGLVSGGGATEEEWRTNVRSAAERYSTELRRALGTAIPQNQSPA